MKSKRVVSIVLFSVIFLGSCSGTDFNGSAGGGGGTTGTLPGSQQTPVVLTTSADGASATSLILQSKELLMTSTNLFKNLGFLAQSQMVTAASGTGSGVCTDYGTYNYTRTYSGGQYTMIYTFNLCRESDFQYDGSLTAIGTPATFTEYIAGLKILNFKNNYTTLIGSMVGSSLSVKMAGTGDAVNGQYTITMNGSMVAFDYYTLGQHSMIFTALVSGITVTTDGVTNIRSTNVTANGKYSVQRTNTKKITYQSFSVNTQKQLVTNIEDVSISGRLITDTTPNSGLEGVLDVTTVTSIRTALVPYPPTTTQGTVVTNSSATAQYGAVNSIIVSVGTDTPQSFAKEFMLMKQSDFYAMEQQLPLVSGTTGTASGTVMSISALSTGPSSSALNCYTDVHVSYFLSTAPTATIPNWYVHWNSNLNTCVPQAGIPYQEATSSTGIATNPCDVGLDINGAATDITSGGVEHFLAAALPTGYYVLSIDNYSCATTVTNDATILVGDYLFGPYNCTYTSSDVDGSTPGAWCRLADIRVNASGVIDVLAPDGAIPPWHP
jgi:hypothetical protein